MWQRRCYGSRFLVNSPLLGDANTFRWKQLVTRLNGVSCWKWGRLLWWQSKMIEKRWQRESWQVQHRTGLRVPDLVVGNWQMVEESRDFSWTLKVRQWREDIMGAVEQWCLEYVIQWDCYSSCVKARYQEATSGECNRLRTRVCNGEMWSAQISDSA
jgi:hypothetical protein